MKQREDDRWKRESPEREINMLSGRMKTFYRQMNKYINLTVKQQKAHVLAVKAIKLRRFVSR